MHHLITSVNSGNKNREETKIQKGTKTKVKKSHKKNLLPSKIRY